MVKFILNKIGRDKGVDSFKAQGVSLKYRHLTGTELCDALKAKLLEESLEVSEARATQEVTAELADLLEVIDGLCKAYGISQNDLERVKEDRHKTRGGFETGLYIELIEMDEGNPRVEHFRASPDKYPEV